MNQKELRTRVKDLPRIEKFDHQWQKYRKSMRFHMLNEKASEFLKWSTVKATVYDGMSNHIDDRYKALSNKRFKERYLNAIKNTPSAGSPVYYDKKQKIGANYIHQAHHLMQLERHLWLQLDDLSTIVEFGGGYGALCSIARRLGFDGNYHIFDFPEMLLLQEYYLGRLKRNATFHAETDTRNVDLLIAILSLSEAPIAVRQEFLARVTAKFYYIRFQQTFFDIDNKKWFEKWAKRNLEKWNIHSTRLSTHFVLTGTASW